MSHRSYRPWTESEEHRLEVQCAIRPEKTWQQISRRVGRSPGACRQHAYAVGYRRSTVIYEACLTTNRRSRYGQKGCACDVCERKRVLRRSHTRFNCAACGESNVIFGTGSQMRAFLEGQQPGAVDGKPPHEKIA